MVPSWEATKRVSDGVPMSSSGERKPCMIPGNRECPGEVGGDLCHKSTGFIEGFR